MSQPLIGKKICIVHPQTLHTDVRLPKTIDFLAQAGAEISVACSAELNPDSETININAKLIKIANQDKAIPSSENPNWLIRVLANKFIKIPQQKRFAKMLARDPLHGLVNGLIKMPFDAFHFINYNSCREANHLSKKSNKPYVYESYECWQKIIADQDLLNEERLCVSRASATIVVSEPIKELYSKFTKQSPKVIYNVAPSMPLEPRPVHRPLRFYLQSFIRKNYGIESALAAFSLVVGDYRLTIQGPCYEQGYLAELKTLANQLGINDKVEFKPSTPFSETVKAAHAHDVGFLLLPSNTINGKNYNGMWSLPNKLFTYGSAGLAMVFSEFQSATKELIGDSNASIFVNGDDPHCIAKIFQELIDQEQLTSSMKEASYDWIQSYTPCKEAKKLVSIYLEIL